MKVYAHVDASGAVHGLVATQDGSRNTAVTARAGDQLHEIVDHVVKGESHDLKELTKIFETHTVDLTPARAKMVQRKK